MGARTFLLLASCRVWGIPYIRLPLGRSELSPSTRGWNRNGIIGHVVRQGQGEERGTRGSVARGWRERIPSGWVFLPRSRREGAMQVAARRKSEASHMWHVEQTETSEQVWEATSYSLAKGITGCGGDPWARGKELYCVTYILLETPAGVRERLATVRLASKTFPGNGHSVPPSSTKGKVSRLQNTKYLSKYI